jgi:hypothetical protein
MSLDRRSMLYTYLVDGLDFAVAGNARITLPTGDLGQLRTHHGTRHGSGRQRGRIDMTGGRGLGSEGAERCGGRVAQEGADVAESEQRRDLHRA